MYNGISSMCILFKVQMWLEITYRHVANLQFADLTKLSKVGKYNTDVTANMQLCRKQNGWLL